MNAKTRLAVLGDLLYDCFVWADHLPRVGETVTGYQNGFFAGGKGGNQAVAASRLGADTYMLGKVGRDERGEFLIKGLGDNGVHTAGVFVDPDIPTGTCCVHVDQAGRNAIIVVPQANDHMDTKALEDMYPLIKSLDVFLCQLQINLDAVQTALTLCKKANVTTVFNPAPAKDIPDDYFRLADYVTPNETETEFFTGLYRKDMELDAWCKAAAERLHDRGAKRLLITLGEHGAYFSGDGEAFLTPSFRVDAVDSTAAGDAFNAAFAIRIAQGDTIHNAVRYANAAGALTAKKRGSQPSLPTAQDVAGFLAEQEEAYHAD